MEVVRSYLDFWKLPNLAKDCYIVGRCPETSYTDQYDILYGTFGKTEMPIFCNLKQKFVIYYCLATTALKLSARSYASVSI